ncbi:subtilisin-like protein [Lentinus tigrinus ALCF2SS1-7]|uniref:tripeptidyl-peptidase II n=1 Tax=Lentinus tigrinus ALCF2SS1-6 TaxID=1328759 RepID=A0A5C2RZW6_9APHY|nr:subtilisin-like protein [Lentinus tigrinus ALCF2SS1-6]RPD71655.1 subtilisin-like protein [Lentinus tigrinus ALCF2SS1-7]
MPSRQRRTDLVLHEKRAAEPLDWVRSRRLEPTAVLPMRLGLTQSNMDKLEDMLMSVSHPLSPSYGKHFSPQDIVDTFAPSDETVARVTEWLVQSGIGKERLRMSPSKGWIAFNATVEEVEDLIDAEYHVYTHEESGAEQIGCHSYSVPESVRSHIDLIKPTVHFLHRVPTPDQLQKRAFERPSTHIRTGPKTDGSKVTITPSLENCDETITLDCLRALYSIDHTPVSTDKNTFGILEFTPQAFLQSDLDMFFANFSPSQVGTKPILISIDGGVDQTNDTGFNFNGESDLDLQYAFGLTNPQPILLLQTGDLVEGASFNNWLDAVDGTFCTFEGGDDPTQDGIYPDNLPGGFDGPESCGILTPPFVVSTSYGSDEGTVTAAYAQRQCAEYAKLGMLGTTVLYSSGDDGVAGNGGICLNANGQPSRNGKRFSPDFPVTCPFVTAVGATQVNPGSTVNDPEGACEQVIFSGGGFSNIFAMPDYQAAAVTSFLTNHPPPFTSAQFNNSGKARGFPDLSANGANYVVAVAGEFVRVFGTSCSSPVVGSMITLINDARLAAGKGSVGFINPAIYSDTFTSAFHDITTGGNQGCGTPGFTSTEGWDPVTGVGTPNFTALLPLFLDLP